MYDREQMQKSFGENIQAAKCEAERCGGEGVFSSFQGLLPTALLHILRGPRFISRLHFWLVLRFVPVPVLGQFSLHVCDFDSTWVYHLGFCVN